MHGRGVGYDGLLILSKRIALFANLDVVQGPRVVSDVFASRSSWERHEGPGSRRA